MMKMYFIALGIVLHQRKFENVVKKWLKTMSKGTFGGFVTS